jgi:hypothetical protein
MGYRSRLPNCGVSYLGLLPSGRLHRLQHRRVFCQYHSLWDRAALAGEPFYKVWSLEVFPTMLRTTAQALTFAVARAALGIWSLFVPTIAAAGFEGVALILVIFLSISGVVGFLFMPNTAGRPLEELEAENYGAKAAS